MTKEIMTLWYRAHEVLLDNLRYSPAIDLWSAGVIIYEMLSGEHMFEGNSEIDMLFKIFNLKGTPITDEQENPLQNITKLLNQKRWVSRAESQPKLNAYNSYPHLKNYGPLFPKFKP